MLTIDEILKILPHRYPFLMVDGVSEVGPDKILAYKNISFNEPQFAGHFPGLPVMPGVLIVEALAQAGIILAAQSGGFDAEKQVAYFMTIDSAKFRRPVLPGDTVEYHVRKIRNRSNIWKFSAEALVRGVKVAEATVSALIADEG